MVRSLSTKDETAKRHYQCDYCGGAIKPGQTYERQVNDDDGFTWIWRAHFDCREAAKTRHRHRDWDGVIPAFADWCEEDKAWLQKEYPAIYARMKGSK